MSYDAATTCTPAEQILDHVAHSIRTGKIGCRYWADRWDRMQSRYLARREERYQVIVNTLRDTCTSLTRVLDLGCGTCSLTLALLKAFPQAEVVCLDFDPTLLPLAEKRLGAFADRASFVLADLRSPSWSEGVPMPVSAAVSATALHWLSEGQLAALYLHLGRVLSPRGVFLNADHVGSDFAPLQAAWARRRTQARHQEGSATAEDWESFWHAYADALHLDVAQIDQRVPGGWEGGVEPGMPLAWHFDQLQAAGFRSVDCFWRCNGDAIFGGIAR